MGEDENLQKDMKKQEEQDASKKKHLKLVLKQRLMPILGQLVEKQ